MSVSPPRPKGPPLNALRAFEAAARLGGFAAAAEELNVTPGAISQHIKAIEDWAGTPLFERRAQGVRLTRSGAALAPDFTAGFDRIGAAVRALRALRPDPVIQIAALPSVAQLWLGPRLPALRAALPDLRISVTALEQPPNLRRDMFDLSLFIRAPRDGSGLHVLAHDALVPVAAPDVARDIHAPSDLAGAVRLHDATWCGDWERWAAGADVTLEDAERGPRYSLYAMAVDEAVAGAGILMGHRVLLGSALAEGRLVAVSERDVPTGAALVLEWAEPTDDAKRVIEVMKKSR
ncbi:LysR family transcriptional regulator [Roseovarius sp. SCSIO 43702]|uniref:LysR family transcriptional regulator n=1 Tax=Roseovarius sp. SCSIO 43702 TaxID=2823043 RepID=UPI001C7352AD|nr:LysR family transcriptional regulator [Roseovarius sp. SCSIO 43702]QYX57342.1 LysR family transcriptional regulator [Roseovarius sp. SCSIO 43702]